MSGTKFLLDTNVIVNHLNGNKNVETLLDGALLYISAITFTELISKKLPQSESIILSDYLQTVHVIHTNDFICKLSAEIRRKSKLKLPDAIIAATSIFLDIPFVSFDSDFDRVNDLQIIKLIL
jgi:predicted nucleic acid-binding protein